MLDAQTIQRIAQLQLVTKQLMHGLLMGDSNTLQRGYGVEFNQIREYVTGDDVRFIDWKSSARFNKKLVKECLEERNRTIIVALDVSVSVNYGSVVAKDQYMKDVAAILVYAAHYARDSIGLVLFSDEIHHVLPPKNTYAHVQQIVHALYDQHITPGARTSVTAPLAYCAQHWPKDATVFLVSDFIDEHFGDMLACVARRLDVVAVRCFDPVERALPNVDCFYMTDLETNQTVCADCVGQLLQERVDLQNEQFARVCVDVADITYDMDYCTSLVALFKRRLHRMRGARL